MSIKAFSVIAITLLLPISVSLAEPCPPPGYSREQLQEIRQAGFEMPEPEKRNALAQGLLACVGDPDPEIRDEVAFEGISKWLRAGEVSAETLQALYSGLLDQISHIDDPDGFQQPFAALILSEVARTDRIEQWLTDQQREELVKVASKYIRNIRDYRGYSETEGWRHGIAHASDLVLQLVLNPNITAGQTTTMLEALAKQVVPKGAVFYIYGEPGRLARAVFYAFMQAELKSSSWQAWFEGLTSPAPFDAWSAMYSSQVGLAKRHNTIAFLQAMYLNTSSSDDTRTAELEQIVLGALERVLSG